MGKSKVHIYFFASYNEESVSTRYRGSYVLQFLKTNYSISSDLNYPTYHPFKVVSFAKSYLSALTGIKGPSVIILQKVHKKGIYTSLLRMLVRLRGHQCIYDTDDADYLRYENKHINFFLKNCSYCIVGSNVLKSYAKSFNRNLLVLGTPIISHSSRKRTKNEVLHIGWVGDLGWNLNKTEPFSHLINLRQLLLPAIDQIECEIKLTILGVKNQKNKVEIEQRFKAKKNVDLNIPMNIDWRNEEDIYMRLSEFDIGISPLNNHEFNRAKSAFKLKQYLSVGVPSLASPTGENIDVLEEGYNGYFCKNSLDFKEQIDHFNKMGIESFAKFSDQALLSSKNYQLKSYCEQLMKVIEDVIQSIESNR